MKGVAACGLAAFVAAGPPQRPGELMVAPTRVVLEGRDRAAELTVMNKGAATATYRISIVEMRMMPDGRLERVTASDGEVERQSAKALVRFAPRQVTLEPGESQKIRVAVQKPPNLPAGEYRSHLLLEAVPNSPPPTPIGQDNTTLTLRLNVIGAITLPLVVRQGQLSAGAEIRDLARAGNVVNFSIHRTGTRSIRGDLTAYFIPENSRKKYQVGLIREMPVYSPNAHRIVRLNLTPPEGVPFQRGKLLVLFEEPTGVSGRAKAQAEMTIP